MGSLNVDLAKCPIKTIEGLRRKAQALCWWCSNGPMISLNPLSAWMLASLLDDILCLDGETDYKTDAIWEKLKPDDVEVWIEHSV